MQGSRSLWERQDARVTKKREQVFTWGHAVLLCFQHVVDTKIEQQGHERIPLLAPFFLVDLVAHPLFPPTHVLCSPGFHTTARELHTCTFQGPNDSNTTKIPRKDQERERRKKIVAEEGKKARNFGPSTLLGSTLRGPIFSRFRASTLWALPPFEGPTLCRPKIQHPKIGRSRNWPKSKLAELEQKLAGKLTLLFRRVRQQLPFAGRACQCGRLFDSFGHHRAARLHAGVLSRRGFSLPHAFAEVWGRVRTNAFVRDLDVPDANAGDGRMVMADLGEEPPRRTSS